MGFPTASCPSRGLAAAVKCSIAVLLFCSKLSVQFEENKGYDVEKSKH